MGKQIYGTVHLYKQTITDYSHTEAEIFIDKKPRNCTQYAKAWFPGKFKFYALNSRGENHH